ncbi:uncharacterized protein CCOS01_12829 [Colletotrichum costaricense]|uniref:Uncharacterized protein n=1 Tax=Colletotrichum costaricense TaxID=1209916 RepID=A0AAI9YLQ8_9PEZI|nr:uncharacterized protein CCOS01_12829 [Colletotrichum costaricense]KAK1515631.1 hypothetical protein CCOS01_12829 [Colletotrichum costaricense]
MDSRGQDDETRQVRRKPVPSYVPPLGYDEALLLSSAHTHVYDWEQELESTARPSDEPRSTEIGRDLPSKSTFASGETEYELVKTSSAEKTRNNTRRSPRRRWQILKGWWPEIIWCLISVVCIIVLISVLRSYDNQPLPNWPLGLTLNTVVAFISTFCRTSFVLPVVESLSQYKWNWYKSPRPLGDFAVFDEASRGPWGSLKLLLRTKGRLVGILSAVILVSGIATSTLTQSVVTYPTRQVAIPGNETALTRRNNEYFWATANGPSRSSSSSPIDTCIFKVDLLAGDIMFPINQIIPRSLYTPPNEVMPYYQASCRSNNCTWDDFTSLAICVDMKNVTDLLETDGDPIEMGTNSTLPNGLKLQRSYGYGNLNISSGPSLAFNGTDAMGAKIWNFFVINGPRLRATEIMLHWCVNTYRVTVQDNLPVTQKVASYTNPQTGEVLVETYNMTSNVTYLTSPDNPGKKYVADGMGPAEIAAILDSTLSGTYIDGGTYMFQNGTQIYGTALSRAAIGINETTESHKLDDALFTTLRNLTENIASGLTNANVSGTAWQEERFVSIRWPWLTLLAAQVGLSILTLAIIMAETASLDIEIVKGSPLPALLAVHPDEKSVLLGDHVEETPNKDSRLPHLRASGITGGLRRDGEDWVLQSIKR